MKVEERTTKALALSERVRMGVDAVLEDYAEAIDNDPHVRAIRLEVRVRPDRRIRTVIYQQQGEIGDD